MLDPMVQNAGQHEEEVNGNKLKSNQTQVCVLADLMKDPMIKKAGLREEEVLALMLYTGLCPAPPSPPPAEKRLLVRPSHTRSVSGRIAPFCGTRHVCKVLLSSCCTTCKVLEAGLAETTWLSLLGANGSGTNRANWTWHVPVASSVY